MVEIECQRYKLCAYFFLLQKLENVENQRFCGLNWPSSAYKKIDVLWDLEKNQINSLHYI